MWSVILMLHAVPHNFAGIMVLRFFLGVFESLVSPGFSLITSVWYKQSEHASRHGVWFIGNSLGSIFGGLISYGIAQITTFTPWKVLFLLYGGVTFVWGLVMIIFLPDSPSQASFLSDRQRQIAASRVASSQLNPSRKYNKDQIHEVFRDPVTYLLFAYSFLTCMANGALTNV